MSSRAWPDSKPQPRTRQQEFSQAQQLAAVQRLHFRYLEENSHLESQMADGADQILQQANQTFVRAQVHSGAVSSVAEHCVALAEQGLLFRLGALLRCRGDVGSRHSYARNKNNKFCNKL